MLKAFLFSIGILLFLNNCGLPSITSIEIEPHRPEISGYYDGTSIIINLNGYYPSDQFPNFNGFNIYFGNNNTESDILKRVLYISDITQLPSYASRGITNFIEPPLTIGDNFNFRLTSASDAQDLTDEKASDINQELSRTIETHNRFYFIARPLNNDIEYDRSETLRIYISDLNTNRVISIPSNAGSNDIASPIETQFSNTSVFSIKLERNNNTFTIRPSNPSTSLTVIGPNTIENNCYRSFDTTSHREEFHSESLPLSERSTYVFISDLDNAQNYQYRIYIREIDRNNGTLTLCTAYERS